METITTVCEFVYVYLPSFITLCSVNSEFQFQLAFFFFNNWNLSIVISVLNN